MTPSTQSKDSKQHPRSWVAWLWRPSVIAPLVAVIYALVVVMTAGDWLALVTIGERFAPDAPHHYSEEGYDGQFVYFITQNPSTAAEFIARGGDVPAYRFQRILLPALGWIGSFGGQAALVPVALLIVNVAAIAAGTWALESILGRWRRSPWLTLGYALSLAILTATRLSLTEPLAYGLAAMGLAYALRDDDWTRHWKQAAVCFALAALAKETTLLIPAGIGLYGLWQGRYTAAIRFGVAVLLPFVLWQAVLYAHFGAFGIGSGGNMATGFEIVPFAGVWAIYTYGGLAIFAALMTILAPFVLLPTIWALWRVVHDVRHRTITLMTGVLLMTALIMLFVPFSTYREPLGILRFIAGLQIAVIVYAAERRQRRALLYSVFWALTSLLVISSDLQT